jgi:DNA-binding NarL/FixJ family response regulator
MNADPQKSLLIVEDHAPLRRALRDWLLLELPSWTIRESGSAEEALASMTLRPPDIVLMDIALPLMDGVTATMEIQKHHPGVRCVIMTMYDSPEYRSAAQAAGAKGFINKLHVQAELLPLLAHLRLDTESAFA